LECLSSYEFITYLSAQRVIYSELWANFKYSEWQLSIRKLPNEEVVYVLQPKRIDKYKQHRIANLRRNYILTTSIFRTQDSDQIRESYKEITRLSESININDIETLYRINESDYFKAKRYAYVFIDTFKCNTCEFYLGISISNIKVHDIISGYEYLRTIADIYKVAVYAVFDEENMAHYKYLSPIINLDELVRQFSRLYHYDLEYAHDIISLFTFNNKVRGESDIFSKPLIFVGNNSILLCPTLIVQMNLERIIEMLALENNIDLSPIGKQFEQKLRNILSFVPIINVNTNKVEFVAYDGKDVEFDFIGTFDDYLLLFEFKAVVTPYSDKRLHSNEEMIQGGIEQILRRSKIIQKDWDKIRRMCNIRLPEKPISDDKIIKILGTNIFDFNTLVVQGVRITDESTLLKFFLNPVVKVVSGLGKNKNKVVSTKKIWKGATPTVNEFLSYLDNPVTTSPYNDCFEAQPKLFDRFEGDYPVAIIDQVLVKDPYRSAIQECIAEKSLGKVGRNDQCPCGSGKKYKKCCGQ
jgi:hypothetical protein